MEDSAKGWSDFGGGCEGDEKPYQTALREGGEELTGFLGDGKELEKHIKKNGGIYHMEHNEYHSHLFFLEYDENLPKYYNLNHAYLWERMNKKVLNDSRLFEKIEIQWFSIADMKKKRNQFRGFYREIVDTFIADERNIFQFANRRYRSKKNKTSKKQESLF